MNFVKQIPTSSIFRKNIYEGEVFLSEANTATLGFTNKVKELIIDTFGEDYRHAHKNFDEIDLFEKVGLLRRTIYLDPYFHDQLAKVLEASGLDPLSYHFDPARLRVVVHKGHENRRAAPVYYGHRDTWYAHPQTLITWWLPLDDLEEQETFVFYPDMFSTSVPNDSEIFDYDEWTSKGWGLKMGWQNRDDGLNAKYPTITEDFEPGEAFGFSCKQGMNLVFAGSQYHCTRKQETGKTRFSLDFRLVHVEDTKSGLGAPNVDNRSRGNCMQDYLAFR